MASYDYQEILAYCQMRLNNGAAVVRFKFSSQEAFEQARADWINGDAIQEAARYYMTIYGMSQCRVSLWNSGKHENYLLYVLKGRGINRYG